MKWLHSKWFDKVFIGLCYFLIVLFTLGFIVIGGFLLLLLPDALRGQ